MQKEIYTLLVQGQRIPVSEEVYRVYYKERERERYLEKKAASRELSQQALEDMGMPVDYRAGALPSAETMYFNAQDHRLLYEALDQLPRERREQFVALVLGEITERELADTLGLSRSAIHRRKKRDLEQVRNFISQRKALEAHEGSGRSPF